MGIQRRAAMPYFVRMAALPLALAASLLACKPRNQYQAPPPPEVTVQKPVQRDITNYLNETGQLAPVKQVNLIARIEGVLERIGYDDGQPVKQGTVLFVIEPPPYKAQLEQARANVTSAEASAEYAVQQNERFTKLAKTNAASEQNAEQSLSQRKSAEADLQRARAAEQQASITYSYTHIAAPFDGVVSAHQQDVGALVGGSHPSQLATIVELDPIWANFNLSSDDVARVRERMQGAGLASPGERMLPVEIELQGENGYPHKGHINYTAPQIDASTGTLAARGTFGNSDHKLLPGSFVRIRVPLSQTKGALLVPDAALGADQGGRFLLLVDGKNTVKQQTVSIGAKRGDLRIIEKGLKPDDRVIVNGMQRAQPGKPVRPHEASDNDKTAENSR